MAELTVTQLAGRLGVSTRRARALVADDTIAGRRLPSGDWLADSESVARYELRRRSPGRRLDVDTAWAILLELSGLRASGMLPRATYQRAKVRIQTSAPEDLAIDVAGRTLARRFRSANPDKAKADLIPTGRAAVSVIESDLLADDRRVQGYVPFGTTFHDYARTHFMVEDATGPDTLYENTAPGGLTEPLPAVVAADLAMSTDTRERSAGLHALGALMGTWLAENTR